jgi:hypothetical protein
MQLKWDELNPTQFQFLLNNWSDMSLNQYQEFVEDRVKLYVNRYEHGLDLWSGKCLNCNLNHDNNEDCKEIALSKTRM